MECGTTEIVLSAYIILACAQKEVVTENGSKKTCDGGDDGATCTVNCTFGDSATVTYQCDSDSGEYKTIETCPAPGTIDNIQKVWPPCSWSLVFVVESSAVGDGTSCHDTMLGLVVLQLSVCAYLGAEVMISSWDRTRGVVGA